MAVIFKMARDLSTLHENSINRPDGIDPTFTILNGQDVLFNNPADHTVDWLRWHLDRGIDIRLGLRGLRGLKGFQRSSQLEFSLAQMYKFVEVDRENWTYSKKQYRKIELNFSVTLYNVIVVMYKNLVFNLGVKPPVGRMSYSWLKTILEFQPFWDKWTPEQQKRVKKYMARMELYYEHFNKLEDDVIRKMIDENDLLIKLKKKKV